MSGFYILPNRVAAAIDAVLDEQIAIVPDAAKDREVLRSQLIEYVAEHGVIPEFSLGKNGGAA